MAEKNNYIIYLRVIATIFVVLIHASTGFLYQIDTNAFDWNYANWINAATRCSVPIFVIISGSLLFSKDEDTWTFYRKRIPKLLYPFIFWTIIYLIYYFYRYTNFNLLSTEKIWSISLDKILHGANAHLWYLYMIIGLYLAIPFLRKILLQSTQKEIEFFLLLWLLSMCFTSKPLYKAMPKFDLTFFSGYAGYLVLGYYIRIRTFNFNYKQIIFASTYLLMVVIGAVGTNLLNENASKLNTFFYNYVFVTTAIAAGALFLWVKEASQRLKTPRWISTIDKYSFGVYLSHIIPLNFLHPLISKHFSTVWVIPLATAGTVVASVMITYLLRKMPYGKYVSG
ncbi:acyltransferase family protein [Sphingobacterium sp. DK4209]|uniref:Acyltransferase family protein n=1 Tax=Sphingobacterium zhuxiongii TaxID=2662364 RepID=A0A5Q0Q4H1_9SPHI|nr:MULTISPECIES: acyltransferase family protein [unclassified Sphingobacterium]MVZ66193.1 acyltransferase family protein [Sphingobacterium sp. DK4209]QGA24917.1 acyltransferase family protein [Sphingobacterium sp. dk4302]